MKLTRVLAGYTIIEVIVVLAVTAALFISVMAMMSGQQQRTEFGQSARDLESRIQDILNDVSSGYNTKNINVDCVSSAAGPVLTTNSGPTDTQGTNDDCIFLGRAIQFTTSSTFRRLSLVGLRTYTAGSATSESKNVTQAKPKVIAPATAIDGTPDTSTTFTLGSGMTIKWVSYNGSTEIGSIAFIGELASYNSSNLIRSDARKGVNLVPITGSSLSNTDFQAVTQINQLNASVDAEGNPINMNPPAGIKICFDNGERQHGIITIGGEIRSLGTELQISNGACPDDPV